MIFAGIDPGLHGGYCELNESGDIQNILLLQDGLDRMVRLGETRMLSYHIYVERAQVMVLDTDRPPSARASFTYGTGYGEILGVLRALKVRHTLTRPVEWSKVMHLGTTDSTPKKRSLEAATRLFPRQDFKLGRFRVPHDGLFEAALIAEYGRRQIMGVMNMIAEKDELWQMK